MRRREFLAAALAPKARPPLCVFSKHLARHDWDRLGATAKELGFDGIDLTVRPKGHVLPERAAGDLPRAVDAIRRHGLNVPMITTDLTSTGDPAARPTLSTAARLGIPYFKVGYWRGMSAEQVRPLARGLFALAKEVGITAGLHNHSGDYFGAVPYEYDSVLEGDAGFYFDPAHAFIEGGLHGWQVFLAQACRRLKMVAVKDFYWEKRGGKWDVRWCPLGEGMVEWPAVFGAIKRTGFSGPISLHSEYEGGEEPTAMRRDLEFLKKQLA